MATLKQSLRARYLGIPIAPPKASTLPEDVQRAIVAVYASLQEVEDFLHDYDSTAAETVAGEALAALDRVPEFVLIMQREKEARERRWRERMRS